MNYQELRDKIKKDGTVSGVYLLEGTDGYFIRHSEEVIKSACLDMPELDYSCFEGADLKSRDSYSALAASISNFPFGSRKRVVQINDFYPTDDAYEKYVKGAFASVPDTSVVIIKNPGGKKSKLASRKGITYVNCDRDMKSDNVERWVYLTLRKEGVACDNQAARMMAEYCVYDMSRVEIETQKLLATGLKHITSEDVDEYVYKDAEYKLYEMSNAVARKDYSGFCEIMKDLQFKGTDAGVMVSVLLNYFNELHTVLCSREDDDSLMAITGKRSRYGIQVEREQAHRLGVRKLEYFCDRLYSLLADTRNGFITSDSALQCAVAEIFFKS
ncbi:MAG: hypothetical protein LUD47_06930 [Clostridia bacterium]|nr:hypothetical protein [Clostridia bacterium]